MFIKKNRLIVKLAMKIPEDIPSLVDNSMNTLGKWYDHSLGDHRNVVYIKTSASTTQSKVGKFGMYRRSSQLQRPLSLVVEEFKVAKCKFVMTLRDSKEAKDREAGVFN